MTKIDTKEIRDVAKDLKELNEGNDDLKGFTRNVGCLLDQMCDAYDEAQKEIQQLKQDMFTHSVLSQKRISELEKIVDELLPVLEKGYQETISCLYCYGEIDYDKMGNCSSIPYKHDNNCAITRSRAVREGK